MASQGFEWRKIQRGDALPNGAVLGGHTAKDGDVYVGRTPHGVGKLNTADGVMWNIWTHGGRGDPEGEVLVITSGKHMWVHVKANDPLPAGAVFGGRTSSDGDVYPCRDPDGEVGKLNVASSGGAVYNMWYQSHWRPRSEGEVLCVPTDDEPKPEPRAAAPVLKWKRDDQFAQPAESSAAAAGYADAAPKTKAVAPISGEQAAFGLTGHRVELSNNGCTATRSSGVNGAILFSKDPLKHHPGKGYYYEVRVDEKFRSPRAIAVGFGFVPGADKLSAAVGDSSGAVRIAENEARGNFDRMWLAGYDHGGALYISCDHEQKIPDAAWRPVRTLVEGSVIGVLFSEASSQPELVIFQDGTERVRLPATGPLPTMDEQFFAMIDLQGNVSQATLFAATPP